MCACVCVRECIGIDAAGTQPVEPLALPTRLAIGTPYPLSQPVQSVQSNDPTPEASGRALRPAGQASVTLLSALMLQLSHHIITGLE